MRKEEFCEILGDINENYVKEAWIPKKTKKYVWVKLGAVAACLAFCAAVPFFYHFDFPQGKEQQPGGTFGSDVVPSENNSEGALPDRKNLLIVNKVDSLQNADMDVQYSFYNDISQDEWETVLEEFQNSTGAGYDDFTERIPDIFAVSSFYSLAVPDGASDSAYHLHDYVFEYQTADGRKATVALCTFEEPLRDYFFVCNEPEQSEINGVPVIICGHEKRFMAQFSYENVNYDIETVDITLEELEELLSGLIVDSGAVPDN